MLVFFDSDVLKKEVKETGRGQEAEIAMGTLSSYRCGGRIEAQRPNWEASSFLAVSPG